MTKARAETASTVGRNMAAFLDMLAWSEGTDNGVQRTKDRGYDVLVGGALFDCYDQHPNVLVRLPKLGISSTAAGRYQLLNRWYAPYAKMLNLRDFSPRAQDAIAVQQIRERGAIPLIHSGDIEKAIAVTRNIWASLPGAGYGQHEQKMSNLISAYIKAGGVVK